MAKKDRKATERQWNKESDTLHALWKAARELKPLARSRGYAFRFFDLLDSHEAVFKQLRDEALRTHSRLANIADVPNEQWDQIGPGSYGIEPDCQQVIFSDENPEATTYNDRDGAANLRGVTMAFERPDGEVRILVALPETVRCNFQHRDLKYHLKLIVLLHELGHVEDMLQGINFDFGARRMDAISAEVYAHTYALQTANRLGLFDEAQTLAESLEGYRTGSDYRAVVCRKVLDGYQPPKVKTWQELTGWQSPAIHVTE